MKKKKPSLMHFPLKARKPGEERLHMLSYLSYNLFMFHISSSPPMQEGKGEVKNMLKHLNICKKKSPRGLSMCNPGYSIKLTIK